MYLNPLIFLIEVKYAQSSSILKMLWKTDSASDKNYSFTGRTDKAVTKKDETKK